MSCQNVEELQRCSAASQLCNCSMQELLENKVRCLKREENKVEELLSSLRGGLPETRSCRIHLLQEAVLRVVRQRESRHKSSAIQVKLSLGRFHVNDQDIQSKIFHYVSSGHVKT